MATLDAASIELANSLSVDDVPARLRCGCCNKLAVNAVKLPCCDQSICEPCCHDLSETCPVCSHSPISAEDCKINKNLRMTIKAFLKSEEKKRSKETGAPANSSSAVPQTEAHAEAPTVGVIVGSQKHTAESHESPPSEARPFVEALHEVQAATPADADADQDEDDDDDVVITTERPETEEQHGQEQYEPINGDHEVDQSQTDGQKDFGFAPNQQSYGNMDFGNMNFNPMMAMQNGMGMQNFGMGMGNMMGMPGMNMDQSMMFGGGGGFGNGMGMGMNDMGMMNMGMGMGGMNGFNGMPGMGGMGGPNFYSGNGGYNPQTFGNQMHQNFSNRGYGGRPYGRGGFNRGRGYGWRGRGGFGYQNQYFGQNQNHVSQPQQQYQQQQAFRKNADGVEEPTQQNGRRSSPSYEPMETTDSINITTALQPGQPGHDAENDTNQKPGNTTDHTGDNGADTHMHGNELVPGPNAGEEDFGEDGVKIAADVEAPDQPGNLSNGNTAEGTEEQSVPIESGPGDFNAMHDQQQNQFAYNQQHQQIHNYNPRGRGGLYGGRAVPRGGGFGAYNHVQALGDPDRTPAPPINAPTGPKAMREGLPNSGRYSRPQQVQPPAQAPVVMQQAEETKSKPDESEYRARSRSRSRTRSRERSRKHREEEYESDDAYARRKDRERRKRKEREKRPDRSVDVNDDEYTRNSRSRSETPDEHKSRRQHHERDEERPSTRSRRDRSRERRKRSNRSRSPGKDGDDHEYSRRKSKSSRRHDESDGPEKTKDRETSRRHSARDDAHEYESKSRSHESSRHGRSSKDEGKTRNRDREREKHRPVLEEPQDDIGFKIKGSNSASKTRKDASMGPPAGPSRSKDDRRSSTQDSAADVYAQARRAADEARRDRESKSLGKRTSRDEDDLDAPAGPKSDRDRGKRIKAGGRSHQVKYEGEIGGEYDERESRRWG